MKSNAELTVALALFKGKEISWLGMESLCNQVTIPASWELLIAEEQCSGRTGADEILKYHKRLREIGCERIEYYPLTKTMGLVNKFVFLASNAAETSKMFLLWAQDDYYVSTRIRETYDAMMSYPYHMYTRDNNFDYSFATGNLTYRHYNNRIFRPYIELAYRPHALKRIILTGDARRRSHSDMTLFKLYQEVVKKKKITRFINTLPNNSVYTTGFNYYNKPRIKKLKPSKMFQYTEAILEDVVPVDIAMRLRELKKVYDERTQKYQH